MGIKNDIYSELKEVSRKILKHYGMLCNPIKPVDRRRKWIRKRPVGVLYHYTGGPNGVKSMKWANKSSWGNTGSSWHVTILDRMPDNYIGEVWSDIHPLIKALFPVPVIIMCDFLTGTWHGNWSNGYCIGVENRNCGYSGYKKLKNGLADLGKVPVKIGNKGWEPYNERQIICNINIGILVQKIFGDLDPFMILPHQCVWATKNDTGPIFPIHNIRDFIISGCYYQTNLGFCSSPLDYTKDADDYVIITESEPRVEVFEDEGVDIYNFGGSNIESCDFSSSIKLSRLGYFTSETKADLKRNVSMFQRSTLAYKKHKKMRKNVLKSNGVLNKDTVRVLNNRVRILGL